MISRHDIVCPYCKTQADYEVIDDLKYDLEEDGDEVSVECCSCEKHYKVSLEIEIVRNYYYHTEEMEQPEDPDEPQDCSGQAFMGFIDTDEALPKITSNEPPEED